MKEKSSARTKFSTSDSELAAYLMYCGCAVLEIHPVSRFESIIVLNCPEDLVMQWVSEFANYQGNAEVARGMFKSYKDLVGQINRNKQGNNDSRV